MKVTNQSISYKNNNKRNFYYFSTKNAKLKMNARSRSSLITNRKTNFRKANINNKPTKITTKKEINGKNELLYPDISPERDEYSDNLLKMNETIESPRKINRLNNLQSTRVNKKIIKSRIPRRRPVVTANKLSGFHSVTRIPAKKISTKIKVPSDTIITETEKSDCEAVAEPKIEESDEYKIPESPELSPLNNKVSLSLCDDDSYFDDDDNADCDQDTDGYDDDDDDDESDDINEDYGYDISIHCPCESCVNKYKQRKELLHQLKYKHWSTSDILRSARYLNSSSSPYEEQSSTDSSSVYERKIFRKHTREVYTSPKRVKSPKPQFQEKRRRYSFFHLIFDIIFWPFVLFRKAK